MSFTSATFGNCRLTFFYDTPLSSLDNSQAIAICQFIWWGCKKLSLLKIVDPSHPEKNRCDEDIFFKVDIDDVERVDTMRKESRAESGWNVIRIRLSLLVVDGYVRQFESSNIFVGFSMTFEKLNINTRNMMPHWRPSYLNNNFGRHTSIINR